MRLARRLLHAASSALAGALVVACPACGPMIPWPPTVDAGPSDAGARSACEPRARPSYGMPLVVDWPEEKRRALLTALRDGRGLVAARFDGCTVEIVPGCRTAGAYRFTRSARPSAFDHRHYEDASEVSASFPGAPQLAVEARQVGALSLDLVVAGTFDSDPSPPPPEGDCARATHLVASAGVGAFAFRGPRKDDADAGPPAAAASLDACVRALQGSAGDLPPAECSDPLSLVLLPLAPGAPVPPKVQCPEGQIARGAGCVPDLPPAPASAGMVEIPGVLQKLETAQGAARGDLLLRLAELYPPPGGDKGAVIALKPFLEPELRDHPRLEDALLLDRAALLRLGREADALAASTILVQKFPNDPRVAPAYLDVARHYCASGKAGNAGDAAAADTFFEEIGKRFFADRASADVVAEARKTRGTCRLEPKAQKGPLKH